MLVIIILKRKCHLNILIRKWCYIFQMSAVLNGDYDHHIDHLTVIDCRYPYEFEGGHIRGAINLYTKDSIRNFLNETMTSSEKNHVIVFHCEFSSERGPKMYRHLRSLDRESNKDSYPQLNFPEVYLLEGGYKEFYHQFQVCAIFNILLV